MGALFLVKLLALGAATVGGLPAGSYTISPVNVRLPHGQTSTSVNVTSSRLEPMAIQAQIFRWSQEGDTDVLTHTSDIILSPPMATIPSGAVQTFRLLLRPGHGADRERHYRLLLEEIPTAGTADGRLSFSMRASIPVVVAPEQPVTSNLEWRATRGADTTIVLTVTNSGPAYDKIMALAATMPDGEIVNAVPSGTNPYVLPGAQRQWTLRGKTSTGAVHLDISARAGASIRNLPITQ